MEFRAIRNVQYHSRVYRQGAKLVVGKVIPCPFCEGTGQVDGKQCVKCKGTKRSDPPHHFELVDPEAEAKQVVASEKSEADQLTALREEMKAIGAAFDNRWKLPRMKTALIEAKKERGL